MEKIKEYFTNPATYVSLVIFVFGLGATYTTMNMRMDTMEEQIAEMNIMEVKTTLTQIQTDIQWIKYNMQK